MKILSLFITGIFVVVFYLNYKKIDVESNLKKFIIHIIKFKKTVNLFIFSNVLLLVLFIGSLISLLTITIRRQNIHVDIPTFWSLLIAVSLSLLISVMLILLYYKLAYGIILKRLSKNLKQLEKIDLEKEN